MVALGHLLHLGLLMHCLHGLGTLDLSTHQTETHLRCFAVEFNRPVVLT